MLSHQKTGSQIISEPGVRNLQLRFVLALLFVMGYNSATHAQQINLEQVRNGPAHAPVSPGVWVNGNVNASQAHFVEGYSIPYRMVISGLASGTHILDIEWDTKHSGKNAIDYITHFDRMEPHITQFNHVCEHIDPLLGTGLVLPTEHTFPIPEPTQTMTVLGKQQPQHSFNALAAAKRVMTLYNGTILSMEYLNEGSLANATASTSIRITFSTTSSKVVFAWGGHIASQKDWGAGMAAGAINGSPYHMRLKAFNGSGGNMDRSLQAAAVVPPTCLIIGANPSCANTVSSYSAPVGNNYEYLWSIPEETNTSGATIIGANDGLSVSVASGNGGSYDLQILVMQGEEESMCFITVPVQAPVANAGLDKEITCTNTSVTLNGSSSVTGSSFLWTAHNGGNIAAGATTASPTVNAAGMYVLKITTGIGCIAYDTAYVTTNTAAPNASAGNGTMLTCYDPAATLNGSTSIANPQYLWTTSNGHIVSGHTTANPIVNAAGTYTLKVTNPANGCFATSQVIVTQSPAPEIFIAANGPTTFCQGGSVTISASEANGYLWSNGEAGSSIYVTQAGTYKVTATDFYGCTVVSSSIVVNINTLPTVTISADGPLEFCDGNSVTLIANGAQSYVWNNGATSASIIVSSTGSFSVIGTDANGCTGASSATAVTVNPNPVVSINADGPLAFCPGGQVTLTATGATSYLWNNSATTASIVVSTGGTYSVVGTNAFGCTTASAPVNVTINPLPVVSISANGPLQFCDGGLVTLTAGGADSYLWNTGATTASIDVTQSGSYSVVGTNAFGCTAAAAPVSVTVYPLPVVSIFANGPTTFCDGGSVLLTASGASTYLWSTGETAATIIASSTGNYGVTGTSSDGCTAAASPVAVLEHLPFEINIAANGPTAFCEGGSVTIGASEADTYLWSNGEVGSSITVNQAGTYSVTATDFNGCTAASAPIVVIVYDNPTVAISANGPLEFCDGNSVTLTANGALTYVWNNAATSQSNVVTATGSFSVIGTDANGCTGASSTTAVTVNPNPVVTISADGPLAFCPGGNVTLTANGAAEYLWNNGATTASILVSQAGPYSVIGTNAFGCTTASAAIEVVINPLPVVSIAANGPTEFCTGNSVTLTASGAASYLWSNGATTAQIVVSETGSYSVVGSNGFGCTAAAGPVNVTVNPLPVVSIAANGPLTFCDGGSVQLTASGAASYLWSTGETTVSITASATGNYSVVGTSSHGCTAAAAPVAVLEHPQSEIFIAANGPTTFCEGGSVTIGASEADSYLWSTGEFTGSITVSTPGTYSVTATDFNGCTAASAPIVVSVNELPEISIIPSGALVFCEGNSVLLSATGASSYLWNNGSTSSDLEVFATGTYYVTGTDANGCSSASAEIAVLANALPIVSVTVDGPASFCPGASIALTANGAVTYVWSNGATGSVINVAQVGSYAVTGTDANGCTAASAPLNVTQNELPVCQVSAPASLPPAGSMNNTLNAMLVFGASYEWTLTSADGSWMITSGQDAAVVTYKAGSAGTVGTFTVVVTSAQGCTSTCNVSFETAPVQYCSRTQGYYGGKNGKTCNGNKPVQNIQAALASGNIVLGHGARTITILQTEAACLNSKLPSGSTPSTLPAGHVTCAGAIGSSYVANNGRFNNVLLGQVATLSLNVRLDANLGNLVLAGPYMTTSASTNCVNGVAIPGTEKVFYIPESVLSYLGSNNTVNDLLVLANKALGATYIPAAGQPSLSDINKAVDAMNNAFDACRILDGFSHTAPQNIAGKVEDETITENNGIKISGYPNPFYGTTTLRFQFDETTNATLDVFTVTGAKVATLFNGIANAGEMNVVTFDGVELSPGIYLCKLSTDDKSVVTKLVLMK